VADPAPELLEQAHRLLSDGGRERSGPFLLDGKPLGGDLSEDTIRRVMSYLDDFERQRTRRERRAQFTQRRKIRNRDPRRYEALAKNAERVRDEAKKLLPGRLFSANALDRIAFYAREIADEACHDHRQKSSAGRRVEPETRLMSSLDLLLRPVPARTRREWIARMVRERFGIDVGSGEAVRKRLFDYRKKPGRSPRNNPPGRSIRRS